LGVGKWVFITQKSSGNPALSVAVHAVERVSNNRSSSSSSKRRKREKE
jgi:hypothetical protein